jgi:iron complex outermembrane receptor protein
VQATAAGQPAARAVTGPDGTFRLERLAPGTYSLAVTRIGYDPATLSAVTVRAGETASVTVALSPRAIALDAEVVTASRQEEKVLEAPASVSVLAREDIAAHPALTPADRVAQLPGVDVVTSGLTQHNVVTRGFNNAGSGQLLVLTDNRYAAVPSLRINAYNFIPLTDDDLERIEVVRGPGAALYGPNTTAGVMHLITRSPFDSRGTTLSLAGGERGLLQVAGRGAGVVGSSLGWKLSAQYVRAHDFGYVDPSEQTDRQKAILAGADPDTLLIGKRDSLIERVSGEARVDWRANDQTTVIGSVGLNLGVNNLDITGFGAAQVHDWRYQYAQVRLVRPNLFAQAFYNGSDAGTTYLVGTGQRVADRSYLLVGQFQQVLRPLAGETVTWGVDLQRTVPRTDSTIFGRYDADDITDEAGAYLHSETRLGRVDVVAALRLDRHSRVSGLALSPRGSVVLRPGEGQSLRFTYNRAFSTPTSYDLFLDLPVGVFTDPATGVTLPYTVRAMGVPASGLTFQRDCGTALGGLCMWSPFAPGGPLPAEATQLWGALVDSLKGYGYDLSAIPAPSAAQVGSRLQRLDVGTKTFQPIMPDDVQDQGRLGFQTTNTLELGYKGLVGGGLLGTLDLYYSWYHGFSDQYVITPNVFFDPATLRAYLASFVPAARLDTVIAVASALPVGTVSPEQAFDHTDILTVSHHFGRVSLWGVDASAAWQASRSFSLAGSYSWVSRSLFPNVDGVADIALNAPRHKASLRATYHHPAKDLVASATARYVGGFRVISGVFNGSVHRYATLDADLTVPLLYTTRTLLTISGSNLLQATTDQFGAGFRLRASHREFVQVPALRRLLLVRVRVEL